MARVASIFCGAGGLNYGFHKHPAFEVVFACDLFPEACETYEAYFGLKPKCCDITKVDDEDIPEFDVLTGGFPCQGFSIANSKRDVSDKRNVLYLQLVRLLELRQPQLFLFENVRGLIIGKMSNARIYETIV